jgi:hypothetical protein
VAAHAQPALHNDEALLNADLIAAGGELPLSVARLATVIADEERGAVTQFNAFHNTLKLFYYGPLSLMPGNPATRLYSPRPTGPVGR